MPSFPTSADIEEVVFQDNFAREIYDVTGKLIHSERQKTGNKQLTLQRGDLSSGQYLLRIVQEHLSYEVPFVVE